MRKLIALCMLGCVVTALVGCGTTGTPAAPQPAVAKPEAPNPLEGKVKTQASTILQLESRLNARDAQVADLNKALAHERQLRTDLQQENAQLRKLQPARIDISDLARDLGPDVSVQERDGGVALTFLGEVLFDSGKAKLSPKGISTLERAASLIQRKFPEKKIVIEGHTDSQPIRKSKYLSNWELSAHRSLAVLHYLVGKRGFSSDRVAAVAYGATQPVASNATAQGRRKNRRAVIVIKSAT